MPEGGNAPSPCPSAVDVPVPERLTRWKLVGYKRAADLLWLVA